MPNPIMSMLRTPSNNGITKQNETIPDLPKVDKNMSFGQFARLMKNKDPKSIVDQLCASGRMTTQQRDMLYKQAEGRVNEFASFLK